MARIRHVVRTVRFRITAVAALVVLVVLVVAGAALVLQQRSRLLADLDRDLVLRADDLSAAIESGRDLPRSDEDDTFAQVVTGARVVDTTNPAFGEPASRHDVGIERVEILDDTFRVLARPIGDRVLLVAETDEDVADAVGLLAGSLAVAAPVITLLLAGVVWWLVGRTLRPVEAMRAEVEAIDGAGLDRRVPEPAADDEIARLARTMNGMLDRLEVASDRQRRFVADASHELRSPLTRLRMSVEVGDDLHRHDLLQELIGLERLVDDLLQLARADETSTVGELVPVDLDDVVLREARRLRDRGRVDVDVAGVSGGPVLGDVAGLTRVVRNLLDNAERHATSVVSIALRTDGDVVRLTVDDDGPGIAAADASRVFERFTRLDDARSRASGGVGLGLAIVRDLVGRHHGSVRVEASPAGGARFVVELPAAP